MPKIAANVPTVITGRAGAMGNVCGKMTNAFTV